MPVVLFASTRAFDLQSIQQSVPKTCEAVLEESTMGLRLTIRQPSAGMLLQLNEEDEGENENIMGDYGGRSDLPPSFLKCLGERSLHFVLAYYNSELAAAAADIAKGLAREGFVEFIATDDDGIVAASDFEAF